MPVLHPGSQQFLWPEVHYCPSQPDELVERKHSPLVQRRHICGAGQRPTHNGTQIGIHTCLPH